MLDRVTGMQVFVSVATLGSFAAAGRAMGLSQTGVTKHVSALETRLGTRLIHRTTRRLTLTETGRAYLEACEGILADIAEADSLAGESAVEARGTLRLNVPLSFGVREIAPLLPAFSAEHPAVSVDLGLNDRRVDLIEEGWDLAIRIGQLSDSSLIARHLAPCRLAICAALSYLDRHGIPRRPEDLARHNCLGYSIVDPSRWRFETRSVSVAGNLRASNGDALVTAAIAGQGIVYQPTFIVAEALRAGTLVEIDLGERPPLMPIHALMPPGRRPAKTQAFLAFVARRFEGEPAWDRDLPPPLRAI
ncbi:LysR family transcriptional regulator [Methylobacterium brachythecii]|uniref:DNA-binding transcriptional LysR family regulator n=1 Tax=Methylobacterium brachythecii TaxID=1176177 RepID=A0A7W6AJE1_9HYPH|nr:LysR family transcriptional regulator [Methylobacterium brachythecii]MBB3903566.1 DNA-binding transcriptional LysR family regulator [Methylobacterium brachythecii]GLS44082.1 transcriptional regulator [Methylobacterium brachythecii]